MTATQTRPAPEVEADETAAPGEPQGPGRAFRLFGSADHLVIGRLWLATSFVFLALGGALGGALGVERLKTTSTFLLDSDVFRQVLSLHGVSTVFLFLLPALIGVAIVVVPRQVGAQTVAFPRAAAASYWTYLLSSSLVVVSYLINGGPFGGNEQAVDLFLISFALVVVSLLVASVCIGTTVLALRAPGMTMERAPFFSWSMLVTTTIWIASLGVLLGLLVLLYIDSRYRVFEFGGANRIDLWLRWAMTPPQVFAAAIPAIGFASDAVQVFARNRQRFRFITLTFIAMFGMFSFGAWAFYGFNWIAPTSQFDAPQVTTQFLYIVVALSLALPIVGIMGGMVDTLWRGRFQLGSPLLFSIMTMLLLLGGASAAALRVITPLDLVGTTADTTVVHFALGAALLALVGSIHYWWPLILGKMPGDMLGLLTALCIFLGAGGVATFDVFSGMLDQRSLVRATEPLRHGVGLLNLGTVLSAGLLFLGMTMFVVNVTKALRAKPDEYDDDEPIVDPWGGHSLEWAEDPASVPVRSATPLLDLREEEAL